MIVEAVRDEPEFGKTIAIAIADELALAAENLRVVLKEIHNLHRRDLLIVVINLCRMAAPNHAFVNAQDGILNVKEVHIHVAEGSSVVRERAITNGRPGNRGKPAVENGVLRCELSEHGQLSRRKVRHEGVGSVSVSALRGVTLDEALHVGGAAASSRRAAEDLEVAAGEVMSGVIIQLDLEFRVRLHWNHRAVRVGLGFVSGQAVDSRMLSPQSSKHAVQGAVFHHEDNDVL